MKLEEIKQWASKKTDNNWKWLGGSRERFDWLIARVEELEEEKNELRRKWMIA